MSIDSQTGTITFLFTDVEGSTRLLKELGRGPYGEVLAVHHELLEAAIAEAGGEVIDRQSEAYFVTFRSASDCVSAAVHAQRSLHSSEWPSDRALLVRMGIHTGEVELAGEHYLGLAVHRAARIGSAGHGGQVLVSEVTGALVRDDLPDGVSLRDLGEQHLKDLGTERLFQLQIEGLPAEFPALRTVEQETAFDGREGALAEAAKEAVTGRRLYRRSSLVWGALAGVIAAAVAIPIFALAGGSGGAGADAVPADAVGVIDAASGKLGSTVKTGGVAPSSVAYGSNAVWVANGGSNTVTKIDAETHQAIDTIPVGGSPTAVAVSPGAVWVANNFDGTVWRIDPVSDEKVASIPVGNGPTALAYGAGKVWVTNAGDATLVPIDPKTDKAGRPITVGADPSGVAVSSDPASVWVTSRSQNAVYVIDPRPSSNQVTQVVNVGSGPSAVAAGFGSVWVANSFDGTVDRIDALTHRQSGFVRVGREPTSLAVDDRGSVWVGNESGDSVWRIDAGGDQAVTVRLDVGSAPTALAAGASNVYVASGPSRVAHRGGTFTYLLGHGRVTLDPAIVGISTTGPSSVLYDGLVGFKRVGGSEGAQIVPDLATQLPAPTNRGRTYTFRLRSGIRYSNGREVQPEDLRYALERSIPLGSTGGYYRTIVGASGCPLRKLCDLHRGIEIDKATSTITFHLTRPDPDFLYKLALRPAAAVPSGTPVRDLGLDPPPSTGPYRVAGARKERFELVPNPYFREWSRAAKPAGYVRKFIFEVPTSSTAAITAVKQGRADLADADEPGTIPARVLHELLTRYRSRVFFRPLLSTIFLFMNTRVAPFDDVRVRQALNYALDRRKVAQLFGSGSVGITCQVLPPGFLGYRRYCPYTRDVNARGSWSAPDLVKARELVQASGTRGMTVTIWEVRRFGGPRLARLIADVLHRLGYRTRIRFIDDLDTFSAHVNDSRNKVQIGGWGWGADYPAPSTFFSTLLTCKSFAPNSPSNDNQSEFCDPRVDRDVRRALALQVTDPGAAGPLWAKIDREVMRQAPWVPLFNSGRLNFVSSRVGNYQFNPVWFALFDQMWVR